ncbi:MAG: glycoside hydrolase family 27 protein [Bacteroidales bacterium]|nr:glycoside hydrolase family 27 protein [Bacteroidales bacterium]
MKKAAIIYLFLTLFVTPFTSFSQKFENLALTPPMGWNSWNKYACDVSEDLIKEMADAIVSSGMKEAGYEYIVIDDCWQIGRDSAGNIIPDPDRFPSGMKALADYIHSKGLKFGLYSDAGMTTCAGRPGSRGYEFQDARTYASWGVDYLKYDWCATGTQNAPASFKTMRDALYKAGRPIVFSICEWGTYEPWKWGPEIGHLWRTTGDIYHCYDCIRSHGTWVSQGWAVILDSQEKLREYAGPGHWNDPDMMEVGNGMSVNEDRAHFTLWCMLAAPLIAGNDIANMSKETKEILTNKEAIVINQDIKGIQGYRYYSTKKLEIWVKPLANDELAFCFFNRSDVPQNIDFDWKKQRVDDGISKTDIYLDKTEYKVKDIWGNKDLGTTKTPLKTTVPPHDVILIRLSK